MRRRGAPAAALLVLAGACAPFPVPEGAWPSDPAGREALCRDRWPALAPEERLAFAEAADEQARFGRSIPEGAEISLCLAARRSALVQRLDRACTGSAPAPARGAQLVETHLRACAITRYVAAKEPGRDTVLVDAPGAEAARRCLEAPLFREPAPKVEALQAERDELLEEEADLRRLYDRLEAGDRVLANSSRVYGPAPVGMHRDDLARGAAYDRLLALPLVIDAFTARCLWPAEDEADGDDADARARRAVERERWMERRAKETPWPVPPW